MTPERWSMVALVFGLCIGPAVHGQDPVPSVVVMPFTTEGPAGDTTELRAGADRMVLELNKLLWADSTVRWLVYRTRQRPQDPRTGYIVAPRYSVIGAVRIGPGDSVGLRIHVVAVESMDLILRDSARVRLGEETERAPGIARRIVAAMHRHVQRPISLRADSIPAEAVTLVARATEYANQGDTAAAVAALRQVFVVAPRWTVPCVMLRRLQPGEACP